MEPGWTQTQWQRERVLPQQLDKVRGDGQTERTEKYAVTTLLYLYRNADHGNMANTVPNENSTVLRVRDVFSHRVDISHYILLVR